MLNNKVLKVLKVVYGTIQPKMVRMRHREAPLFLKMYLVNAYFHIFVVKSSLPAKFIRCLANCNISSHVELLITNVTVCCQIN